MKLEFSLQNFEKQWNVKFNKSRPVGAELCRADGPNDRQKWWSWNLSCAILRKPLKKLQVSNFDQNHNHFKGRETHFVTSDSHCYLRLTLLPQTHFDKDARNMLRYYWLPINHYLLHLVGLSLTYSNSSTSDHTK